MYQNIKAKLSYNKTENRNSKNQFTIIYPLHVSYSTMIARYMQTAFVKFNCIKLNIETSQNSVYIFDILDLGERVG